MNRAAVAFLAFILFLAFIGILLAATLGHGHKTPVKKPVPAKVMTLPDYASTDATVNFEIDGRIVGDESHQAILISIGQNQREVEIIQGYSGQVVSTQTFYNTQDAYSVFLKALNYNGFLAKRPVSKKFPASPADEQGECAQGRRYILALNQDGQDISRLWASDCGLSVGTYGGNASLMQDLFEAQIPEYSKIVQNVQL